MAISQIWTYLSIDAGWHFLNMRLQPGTGEPGTTKVDHGGDLAKRFRIRGRTSTTTMNPLPQNRQLKAAGEFHGRQGHGPPPAYPLLLAFFLLERKFGVKA
ncbi:MAG: hypothetical protein ACNYWU_01620 [Desulfobacterales bacterium]